MSATKPEQRDDRRRGRVPDPNAWITPELVAETLRVWQPRYRETLTERDAVAILQAVGQIIDVLEHSP